MSQNNSTGPRTPEGKARSSANAIKHGYTGRTLIVAESEREEFTAFEEQWDKELAPVGVVEYEIYGQLIQAAWTLRRLSRAEAELIDASLSAADPLASDDAAIQNKLRLYSLYQQRAERSFHKALAELRKLQEERLFRNEVLSADRQIPLLPRTGLLRRDIARDKRTQSRQRLADLEDSLNAPLPGQTNSPKAA